MRILLSEDHRPTSDFVGQLLARDGHVVASESDGVTARDRAISESFDIFIYDVDRARLDAAALARGLRAAGVFVPLLALSSCSSDDERMLALTAGFDGFLTKPVTATALLREVAVQEAGRATHAHDTWDANGRSRHLPTDAPATNPLPRPQRGVLGGLVVIAMGLPFVLQALGVPNAASYLFLAMGLAFLISFVRGHQYVYLIPMVTLTSFGVALLLPTWIAMRPEAVAPAFVAIVALGFLSAFVLVPTRRWPLIPAAVLGAVAAIRLVTGSSPIPTPLEPFLVPVVLVGVGAYLLVERQ